jgi:hypothetical protein
MPDPALIQAILRNEGHSLDLQPLNKIVGRGLVQHYLENQPPMLLARPYGFGGLPGS